MKLKHQVSQTTTLDKKTIIANILAMLQKRKYGLNNFTTDTVNFTVSSSSLPWTHEYFGRLNGGKFEVIANETGNTLICEYYPVSLFEYIFISFVVIMFTTVGIVAGTVIPTCMSMVIVIQVIFQYFKLNRVAKELVEAALNEK